VDSLFDASMFEVAPNPVAGKVGEGQLDIFGNVVSADGPITADSEAGAVVVVDPPEPDMVDVPSVDLDDPDVDPDDDPDVLPDTDPDADPGDVLNDPNWEPPLEVPSDAETNRNGVPMVQADAIVRGVSADHIWSGIVGQPAAVDLLRAAAQQPVHAYLFVGPPGSGRRSAARAFAAALLCPAGGCGTCNVCVRSRDARHPDVVEVERDGASITVDQAREIIRLAMRSPIEGERKVIVLVDFHLVTNAAPTLLKIIEEPPPSTVFVILADQLTNELVTIASRCMEVRFSPLSQRMIVNALVADGTAIDHAERIAWAAGGRLDRARLLMQDNHFLGRLEFWESVPRRVDGTGAAVSVLAAEALVLIDGAATAPLEARHAEELSALEERLEVTGVRGGAGMKKELQERQKRELKRLRDDELRFGLGVLQQAYRDALAVPNPKNQDLSRYVETIAALGRATDELVRNPNVTLLLAALFVRLPKLSETQR
jgi:DNA polymerase III subunit delta'